MTDLQYERFLDYLDSLPMSNLPDVFEKYLTWENKQVTRLYERGIEGNSNIFGLILRYFREYGEYTPLPDYAERFELNGYDLCCYTDHNCVYQIYKGTIQLL